MFRPRLWWSSCWCQWKWSLHERLLPISLHQLLELLIVCSSLWPLWSWPISLRILLLSFLWTLSASLTQAGLASLASIGVGIASFRSILSNGLPYCWCWLFQPRLWHRFRCLRDWVVGAWGQPIILAFGDPGWASCDCVYDIFLRWR